MDFDINLDIDIGKIDLSDENKTKVIKKTYLQKHYSKVKNLQEVTPELPGEKEVFYIFTDSSFNAFTFVTYFIKLFGHIDELIVFTYSLGRKTALSFVELVREKKINSLKLLISNHLNQVHQNTINILKEEIKDNSKFCLKLAHNHSKTGAYKCGKNYFVVMGSGNFNQNGRFEQYVLTQDKELFLFSLKHFESID